MDNRRKKSWETEREYLESRLNAVKFASGHRKFSKTVERNVVTLSYCRKPESETSVNHRVVANCRSPLFDWHVFKLFNCRKLSTKTSLYDIIVAHCWQIESCVLKVQGKCYPILVCSAKTFLSIVLCMHGKCHTPCIAVTNTDAIKDRLESYYWS